MTWRQYDKTPYFCITGILSGFFVKLKTNFLSPKFRIQKMEKKYENMEKNMKIQRKCL